MRRLAKYYGKTPDQLGKEDIRAFLLHLLVERKLSPNGLTGYCSGLRFFYNEALGWDESKLFIPPRRKSSPLAEVFSPEEVVRLSAPPRGLKQRVLLMSAYGKRHAVGVAVKSPSLTAIEKTKIRRKLMTLDAEEFIRPSCSTLSPRVSCGCDTTVF